MAGRATSPVATLSLKVFTGQINEALRAERRAVAGAVPERLIVVDTGVLLLRNRSPPAEGKEHGDRGGRGMGLSDRHLHITSCAADRDLNHASKRDPVASMRCPLEADLARVGSRASRLPCQ